jgi:hypothetical protein
VTRNDWAYTACVIGGLLIVVALAYLIVWMT